MCYPLTRRTPRSPNYTWMSSLFVILLLCSSMALSGASRPAGLQLSSHQQLLWPSHNRALHQNELRPPAQDLAGTPSTQPSLSSNSPSSNNTGKQPPRPPEPPLGQAAAPAAGSTAGAAGATAPPLAATAPAPPPAGPPEPPTASAPDTSLQAPWQRRTLQLPPHVYLISFVMLLAIMAGLLSCHCYRMCRIARRMRQAAELGVTMSAAGSMLSKRTPQSVIEALPVKKYSSIHSQRHAHSAPPFGSSKGAALQQQGSSAGTGESTMRMDTFVAAAVQLREQLSRASGISSFSFGGRSSTSATAAPINASGQVELQAPAATATATGVPALQRSGSASSNVRLSLGSDPREISPSPAAAAAAPAAASSPAAAPGVSSSSAAATLTAATATASPAAAAARLAGASGCSSNGAEPCAICFEDFADNDDVKQLPCGHFYHCSCIDEWLVRDVTCPLCKAPVLDDELLEQQQRIAAALEASFGHLGAAARRQHMQQLHQDRRERRARQNRSERTGIGAAPAAVAAMAGAEVVGQQQQQQPPHAAASGAADTSGRQRQGSSVSSDRSRSRRGSSTARELLSLANLTVLNFSGLGRAHLGGSSSSSREWQARQQQQQQQERGSGSAAAAAAPGAGDVAPATDVEMGTPTARS